MDVLIITLFVSILLVVAGLILFVLRMSAGDFDHGDRLSLLPLENDEPAEPHNNQAPRVMSGSGVDVHFTRGKADPYGS